jgi:hypothetical protein
VDDALGIERRVGRLDRLRIERVFEDVVRLDQLRRALTWPNASRIP